MPDPAAPHDDVTQNQVPIIAHLYEEVMAEESLARGQPVGKDDPVVRQRVSEMVLRIGAELRQVMSEQSRPPFGRT